MAAVCHGMLASTGRATRAKGSSNSRRVDPPRSALGPRPLHGRGLDECFRGKVVNYEMRNKFPRRGKGPIDDAVPPLTLTEI